MDYKIKGETLTGIADAIREKTGSTEPVIPEDMADKVGEVYEAGKAAEWSKFCDDFQNNGNRYNYELAFGGEYWNDERLKKLKYPLMSSKGYVTPYMMFSRSNIVDLATALNKEEDQLLVLYTAEYTFAKCYQLKRIGRLKCTQYTAATFSVCTALTTIDELTIDTSSGLSPFTSNTNLTYVKFAGENCIGIPIDLSSATETTTIVVPDDVLDDAGNVEIAAGTEITETGVMYNPTLKTLIPALKAGAGKTLNLGANKAKLSDADIITITQTKGWTLV